MFAKMKQREVVGPLAGAKGVFRKTLFRGLVPVDLSTVDDKHDLAITVGRAQFLLIDSSGNNHLYETAKHHHGAVVLPENLENKRVVLNRDGGVECHPDLS